MKHNTRLGLFVIALPWLIVAVIILATSKARAEVSVYRGVASAHLFTNNQHNHDNKVFVVHVNNLFIGSMRNSFDEDGVFAGYMPTVYTRGRLEGCLGFAAVLGYRRWQMQHIRNISLEREDEKIVVFTPIASASLNVTKHLALTAHITAGVAVNAGVRYSF